MGKYNNLLMRFMYDKDRIVYEMTGVRLVGFLDMTEMSKWPESKCKTVLSTLNTISDCHTCPWCIYHIDIACYKCSYAKRNGVCYMHDSTYFNILKRIPATISDIPKIVSLVRRTKLRYWVLRLTGLSL